MPNSIPAQTEETETARKIKIIQALERAQTEVRASRKYVDALEKQVESKESIIKAQQKRQTLSDEAISLLQSETAQLQGIIANNEKAIKIQRNEIEYLKSELDKTNRKLKRSRTLNKYLLLTAAAAILAAVLK